jgi:amidase
MGHELRDLDYMLNHVAAAKPFLIDPECLPTPYTGLGTAKPRSALKIGILKSYGLVQPQPPSAQAIEWAEAQLRAHGFQVTDFDFYQPARAHKIIHELLMHDGMSMARAAFKAGNEPRYPRFYDLIDHALDLVEDSALDREESTIAIATKRFARDVYRKEFLADWINQGDPDIIICPMSPACAHDTGNIRHNPTSPHFWNLLDYPGLAVPTHIRSGAREDYLGSQYEDVEPLTNEDRVTKELWKQHDYTGAPIALNIVAKRHMENELIAAAGMIQKALSLP